ncbi:hypothetical protein J4Q44_G00376800 [Coregonus suidteri]|uniref:Ig-like domain-containing protein n=1 Tax=Coregonus suidteri TaxID=861788 RepID=A0AAN8KT87_9TELE
MCLSTALPVASVSISPQGLLYSGETVTLQCIIPGYTDWTYYWYKNNQHLPDETSKVINITIPITQTGLVGQYRCEGTRTDRPQTSQPSGNITISVTGDTLTISSVAESDQVLYWCQGENRSRSISSIISDPVRVTLNALPTASVKIVTPQGLLYPGETVTLQCDISDYTDWTYRWFRDNQELPIQTRKNTISLPDQAGQYNSATASVKIVTPQGLLYPGETVTLQCDISDNTGWTYSWFRDNQELPIQTRKNSISLPDQAGQYKCFGTRRGRPQKSYVSSVLHIIITGDTLTISRVAESDQGQYWCQGEIRSRSISSIISDPVRVTLNALPKATLTVKPNPAYTGEKSDSDVFNRVSHRVSVSDGGQYWCRAGRGDPVYYTLYSDPVQIKYYCGSYTCKGVKGNKISKTSDAVQLTVSDQPKAVLSIYPQWLNPGDSVSLSCEVDKTSTGWRFSWYRTVPTLTEQSYSFERLPEAGNGTTEDSYTMIPGPTPTGGYVCRAGRGDPVYDTLYSEPSFLWSGDLQPSVSLRISPNTTQHFTSKSLSLSCEEKGNSTGCRLMSYRERGVTSGCGSNWGSITGSTCTINYTYTWSSGVFWYGDVILESPVHPVAEGDFVTLSCKYQKVSSNFKADFYKDGVLIKNETTGEMTIPTSLCCSLSSLSSRSSWILYISPSRSGCGSGCCWCFYWSFSWSCCGEIKTTKVPVSSEYSGPLSPRAPTRTPNRTKDLPRARLLILGIHISSMVTLTSLRYDQSLRLQ